MTGFEVEVFQNPYLPPGGTKADAIVSVTARGGQDRAIEPAASIEVIIVDGSGSMGLDRRMSAAKAATVAAIDALRDGTYFAVLRGSSDAQQVYPAPGYLAQATPEHRAAAKAAVGYLRPQGGTCFGRWLEYTADLVGPYPTARRHAILLTDGMNEERPRVLAQALSRCVGVFECDCRGIGADWQVAQLRTIATTLLGTVDIIPHPDQMEVELRLLMQRSMGKHAPDVALEVWTPVGASVRFVKQVLPFVEDVTGRRVDLDPQRGRYPVGAWGDESRSYHLWVDIPAHEVDDEMLAARVQVTAGGGVVGAGKVIARWTDEAEPPTRVDPVVAHYIGQAEMAAAIERGLDALRAGDRIGAEHELGRAAGLASAAGNEGTLRLLAGVADQLDAASGTVRLRPQVEALAERTLEAESTKTVAVRRAP